MPSHCYRMRVFDRDLIRGGHYGQRSCEPHLKAEHMAAPTNAANVKKVLVNSEPSTHGTSQTNPKAQNLRSVLMQSGHLWTAVSAEPAANDPKQTSRDFAINQPSRPRDRTCGVRQLTTCTGSSQYRRRWSSARRTRRRTCRAARRRWPAAAPRPPIPGRSSGPAWRR